MDTSPVIDIQAFRATITTRIEKAARQDVNPAVVPLAQVADYASIASAWAALQWNEATSIENHVSIEWFRTSVLSLVSGVVTDVASQGFADRGMNSSEYLDPTPYNPFNGFNSNANKEAGEAEAEQAETVDTAPVPSTSPRTRDLGGSGPGTNPEYSGGIAPQDLLSDRPAKRARLPGSAPPRASAAQNSAGNEASSSTGPEIPRRAIRNVRWTEDEANIVKEARERGEDWDTIQTMVPRHTKNACQSKHQTIIGNRARSDAAKMAFQRA